MFTTHDRGPGQPAFRTDDGITFSSDDLLNYQLLNDPALTEDKFRTPSTVRFQFTASSDSRPRF